MAGHMISQYLRENTSQEIVSWGRNDFEVLDTNWEEKIKQLNQSGKIDFIINCIGILRAADKNPLLGVRINSLFPHELAKIGSLLGAKIIHLSTDCWKEEDVYGRSKRAGEINYPDHLTIRTSIIGPELKENGTGLFHWFMSQKGETNGFTHHIWDGVTTLELARTINYLIDNKPEIHGIIDLRTEEKVSKYDLLEKIKGVFGKNIVINKKETEIVDKTNKEPDIIQRRNFLDQLEELNKWILAHKNLYIQYFSEEAMTEPEKNDLESPIFKDHRGEIHRHEIQGVKHNTWYTKAGVMRSGDYHPNIQYDIILSGRVRLTLRKGEEDVSSEIGPGELIEIPPNTPHLFEFLEDTVMLEWWDGEFSAEYYGPYRDLIDAQAKENA